MPIRPAAKPFQPTASTRIATAARRATPAVVQPMERRVLMSAAVLANGVLTVTGTAGADTITVYDDLPYLNGYLSNLQVTVDGQSQEFAASSVQQVVVNAGDGNDTVTTDVADLANYGTALAVAVNGGAGDDQLTVAGGTSVVHGNDGNDTITTDVGTTTAYGDAGDDTFLATADYFANDPGPLETIYGGAGNDTFKVVDEPGSVTFNGGDGTDTADFSADTYGGTFGVTVSLDGVANDGGRYATDNIEPDVEVVLGSTIGTNHITGDAANNTLIGGAGNDTITGGGGNDSIVGNGGDDSLTGSAGNDTILGGDGFDTIVGGGGTDSLDGGANFNVVNGVNQYTGPAPAVLGANGTLTVTTGADDDEIAVQFSDEGTISADQGDTFTLNADNVAQTFPAASVKGLIVNAGAGDDTITVDGGERGDATAQIPVSISGGDGDDQIDLSLSAESNSQGALVSVDGGTGNDDIQVNMPQLGGVSGPAEPVVLSGDDGNDNINFSGDGTVTLNGGAGDDTLTAGAVYGTCAAVENGDDGNDDVEAGSDGASGNVLATLNGGAGNDTFGTDDPDEAVTVNGGAGTDTFVLNDYQYSALINMDGVAADNQAGFLLGTDVEDITGYHNGPVTIIGNNADNMINISSNGPVTVFGGGGNDQLTVAADGNVSLSGDAGNDVLAAGTFQGVVTLNGGVGDDTLVGSAGQTVFIGGAGTDLADFSTFTDPVTVYLDGSKPSGTAAQITAGTGDTFDGSVEEVYGGSGNDLLVAAPGGGDGLYGNAGNDTLAAQGGADALFGGDGNDLLNAADGGPTYVDGGAGTNTAYVDATGDATLNVETVIPPTTGTTTQLTGITYGTGGSYANSGNTVAKATDGTLSTYFDSPSVNGSYVAVDLGSAKSVTQIEYAPRSGWAARMVGGVFQASNTADFSSGVVNVYTVTAAPTVGVLTTVTPTTTAAYRYWRYLSPNGSYGNIAEFQLFGTTTTTTTPTPTPLTGTTSGTAGSYRSDGNTIAKATDGDLTTYFDGPTANGDVITIDLGSAKTVAQIKYAPRSGWAARMVGGIFQASNTADFSSGVVNAYTVTATPTVSLLTTVTPSTTTAYRYWRYVAPNGSYGNIAEFQLFGTTTSAPLTQRTGTTIGTAGSYQGTGNTIAKATDGSAATYFDGPTANGDWVGLDLGSATTVSQISYAPRAGWESRMVGGIFQASNTADFSAGVVKLYTVTATPAAGSLTTITLSTPATYRYYRYLAPANSYGNIAEFQLFG